MAETLKRRIHHLPNHIYEMPGTYFFTICAHNRSPVFSSIDFDGVRLSAIGKFIEDRWAALPSFFEQVTLLNHVVMPNHFHGLLTIHPRMQAAMGADPASRPASALKMIRAFKAAVTRLARETGNISNEPLWQRDYWDHVVRDEQALSRIMEYIANNPLSWHLDQENPDRIGTNDFYYWLQTYEDDRADAVIGRVGEE
jgi:REP element-mobilizing transposase RayT